MWTVWLKCVSGRWNYLVGDEWLDRQSSFGWDHPANHYFKWFHVFEDELNHRGQIRLIVKELKKRESN